MNQNQIITDHWIAETLHNSFRISLKVDKILFEQQTNHHHLIIFENDRFGRVLMLDNIVQLTQADEFIYHEMMAHIPVLAHPAPENILIIGGGDGGVAREVLRHKAIQSLTLCEIDGSVIEMGKRYFPFISDGAFNDPRMNIEIMDGTKFVAQSPQKFDIIMVDSTDPIGPGAVLFSKDFYANCARCLNKGGILITQNGVPFLQASELKNSLVSFKSLFTDYSSYIASTPTYVGGAMTYGWATNEKGLRQQNVATIASRYQSAGLTTRYYNPEIHKAAFALPNYIKACFPVAL